MTNNLQVVASLLSLQANRVADRETKEIINALRLRIVSMGIVHEKLYGTASADRLFMGAARRTWSASSSPSSYPTR